MERRAAQESIVALGIVMLMEMGTVMVLLALEQRNVLLMPMWTAMIPMHQYIQELLAVPYVHIVIPMVLFLLSRVHKIC